ncbi:unnamed protein product [Eruca vesicaria subsp. sativa]|uniref:PCI domain-containing protein n=1 Tax=Eruca vesicaria subsp. sativa TaxID=29727 RepID=A0ABC8KBA9_ERUVS|nr:unnamed protein product [Eruca vesicaria subsp. sativa]
MVVNKDRWKEMGRDRNQGKVVLRLDVVSVIRFKVYSWHSKRHKMHANCYVEVGWDGMLLPGIKDKRCPQEKIQGATSRGMVTENRERVYEKYNIRDCKSFHGLSRERASANVKRSHLASLQQYGSFPIVEEQVKKFIPSNIGLDASERDFFQLKPYYVDARNCLPPSPHENLILGLNLLRLIVQNRIAEFHTEPELLSSATLENPCIKLAVELEQSFMEGSYNRLLSARQTAPDATYVYFMDLLAKTISLKEIAGCSEKAYDYVSISDARQMLLISSYQELLAFVIEEVKEGFVVFQKANETTPCKEIPSLQLINQTLSYARELERIV